MITVVLLLMLAALSVRAETLRLADGTVEQGELSWVDGKLVLDVGAKELVFDKHKVLEIGDRSATYSEYRFRRDATDLGDTEALMELADWCVSHFLMPEAMALYKDVIELQPDHYEARKALSYREERGKWRRERAQEYRYREARLRCGDKDGYVKLARWARNYGITDGLRECSFYILRMDQFHTEAVKWARPFLKDDPLELFAPLAGEVKVLSNGNSGAQANAYNLFELVLGAVGGGSCWRGYIVLAPCDGKVNYVLNTFEDREGEGYDLSRNNYLLLTAGNRSVKIGGFAKDGVLVKRERGREGAASRHAGVRRQAPRYSRYRAGNVDTFSVPVEFSGVSVEGEGDWRETDNYTPDKGDILRFRAGE
ncbi:MAG: hypothetical protein U5N86_06970 [Planctomycetota bacterium]|nr:hypothetical protein [Planctomycetota bacterium]